MFSVPDPGFPGRRGVNFPVWAKNVLFSKSFAENFMKMKEMGGGGGVCP